MFLRKYWMPLSVFVLAIAAVCVYMLRTDLPDEPVKIFKSVLPAFYRFNLNFDRIFTHPLPNECLTYTFCCDIILLLQKILNPTRKIDRYIILTSRIWIQLNQKSTIL